MRLFVSFLISSVFLFAAISHKLVWPENYSLGKYLKDNNAGSVMLTMGEEDAKYVADIQAGENYYELRDTEGKLLQALIPLGEEMQIHLMRRKSGDYSFDIIPIQSRMIKDNVSLEIGEGYRKCIIDSSNNPGLASAFARMFKNNSFFKRLRPKDLIAFEYSQKEYLGEPIGKTHIKAALVKSGKKEYFAFADSRGRIYQGTHRTISYKDKVKRPFTYTSIRKVKSRNFRMPLDHPRITSRFTYRRWHPILHKYRPHFGVDFGAKRGTPIRAVNDGKVVYAGWMRGYGKVTKIDHGGGFVSLYAHQSRINVKLGQKVKRGQIIGRIGSTGRSTGPHLHLGLYRRGKPVDPLKYISRKGTGQIRIIKEKHTVMKEVSVLKHKRVEIKNAIKIKKRLQRLMQSSDKDIYQWIRPEKSFIYVNDIGIKRTKEEADGRDSAS